MSELRHVHASGKASKPRATPTEVAAALTFYVTDPHIRANLITMTEAGSLDRTLRAWARQSEDGWYVHHPRTPGRAECAILSREPLVGRRVDRLTPLRLRSSRSAPLYAVSARVAGGPWVTVTHTPAHNGGLDPHGKYAWPTRVYLSLLAGWHATILRMYRSGLIVAADWNLDLARQKVRRRLARPYPRMTWGWHPGQAPTEGNRVIDGILTNLPHGPSTTLRAMPGFDHRAVLTVLNHQKEKQ